MTDQDLLKEVVALAMRLGHVEQERDDALRSAESAAETLRAAADSLNTETVAHAGTARRLSEMLKENVELRLRLDGYYGILDRVIGAVNDYQHARPSRRRAEVRKLEEAAIKARTFLLGQRPF